MKEITKGMNYAISKNYTLRIVISNMVPYPSIDPTLSSEPYPAFRISSDDGQILPYLLAVGQYTDSIDTWIDTAELTYTKEDIAQLKEDLEEEYQNVMKQLDVLSERLDKAEKAEEAIAEHRKAIQEIMGSLQKTVEVKHVAGSSQSSVDILG